MALQGDVVDLDDRVAEARGADFRRAFGLKPPDHLKIDVDGIEAAILRGAAETLREVKSVMIEVEGDNLWDVAARIEAPLLAAGLTESVFEKGIPERREA